jgi:hypothetical protein
VAALRGSGGRGKQLGAHERRILQAAGPPGFRLGQVRFGGQPVLPPDVASRSSQTAARAAAARLSRAGLIVLSRPTAQEARAWIAGRYREDEEMPDDLLRRLRLSRFAWRTLLGNAIVSRYPTAFDGQPQGTRLRWDKRLDQALAAANDDCLCRDDPDFSVRSPVVSTLGRPPRY